MAAQTISVTSASPSPSAITLTAAITTCIISGAIGTGVVKLEVSDDGTNYTLIGSISQKGYVGIPSNAFSLPVPSGWLLKATGDVAGAGMSIRIAVQ